MALFDSQAKQRIEQAIAAVEQRTQGEIVVSSVRASDHYVAVRLAFAIAFALASTGLAHLIAPELPVIGLLWLELLAGVISWFVTGWTPLLGRLVPGAYAAAYVNRRARELFVERELFATRGRTGVLILISELERRVVIFGDVGIHAAVKTAGWTEHVNHIVAAIRNGRAADGVCKVIASLGEVLAQDLPSVADDTNELPNTVIEDRD